MAASQVAECSLTLLVQEIVAQCAVSVGDENENAKLEAIGYHVGLRVVERLAKDKPRFGEDLEVVKFICKDFWTAVFKKQIDNLKTNHKGVFVLTDKNFRWTSHISTSGASTETVYNPYLYSVLSAGDTVGAGIEGSVASGGQSASALVPFAAFPCGVIRGAMQSLGRPSVVSVDVSQLPACASSIL